MHKNILKASHILLLLTSTPASEKCTKCTKDSNRHRHTGRRTKVELKRALLYSVVKTFKRSVCKQQMPAPVLYRSELRDLNSIIYRTTLSRENGPPMTILSMYIGSTYWLSSAPCTPTTFHFNSLSEALMMLFEQTSTERASTCKHDVAQEQERTVYQKFREQRECILSADKQSQKQSSRPLGGL